MDYCCEPATKAISKKEMAEREEREKQWRGECDLRAMIDAAKVRADPERLKYAMAAKAKMLVDLETIKAVK